MGKEQSPEILAKVVSRMEGVEAFFIGDVERDSVLRRMTKNIALLEPMEHHAYLNFMYNKVDVGFFSLKGDLSSLCIPSKLYEYLNIGLPMIGAIRGDAREIIKTHGFGLACEYDEEEIKDSILAMKNVHFYKEVCENIVAEKRKWSMREQFRVAIEVVSDVLSR